MPPPRGAFRLRKKMTETREFERTQLLNSFGYVLVQGRMVAFMRRPQPEIHHGAPFPWVMATVGGMRDPLMVLDTDSGPNSEGYMGRPPTGDEVAAYHLRTKLGVKIVFDSGVPLLHGWQEITHPFYYGEKTPDVRNVGSVFRKVRLLRDKDAQTLQAALAARNTNAKPEHIHELAWQGEDGFHQQILAGNHSLKAGEVAFLQGLYEFLRRFSTFPMVELAAA